MHKSSVLIYESIYVYNILWYRNKNNNVMHEMIDECLNYDIFLNIKVLNFIILYFKLFSLLFSFVCYFFFKFYYILLCYTQK